MKIIDYVLKSGYVMDKKPETAQQKVTDYIIARISDYAEDCDENEEEFFSNIMSEDNELENIETLYENLKEVENLEEMEFSNYAFFLLDTELNDNIIKNMERACVEYFETMLSSDIEFLILDCKWEDIIRNITTK